jgi:hypothetical protein
MKGNTEQFIGKSFRIRIRQAKLSLDSISQDLPEPAAPIDERLAPPAKQQLYEGPVKK